MEVGLERDAERVPRMGVPGEAVQEQERRPALASPVEAVQPEVLDAEIPVDGAQEVHGVLSFRAGDAGAWKNSRRTRRNSSWRS